MKQYEILQGDCIEQMRAIPDDTFDSIVTDPPYELGFMSKAWDASGIANNPAMWREALRVLKPGGHLLAFSGSRTYHRMTCAIEDAGFEIRDQIMWVYGSGFPKSMDVSKAIDKAAGAVREVIGQQTKARSTSGASALPTVGGDTEYKTWDVTAPATDAARQWEGWGTALKPAHEPICVARKPLSKGATVAANVLEHGTGALNIDGCRIPGAKPATTRGAGERDGWGMQAQGRIEDDGKGRWPANLIHDGSDEVLALFPAQAGAAAPVRGTEASAASTGNVTGERARVAGAFHADSGSAARFFMECKSSYNDVCPDQNPPPFDALTAALNSSQPSQAVDSVLAHAVNAALPEGLHCSALSWAPSTIVTEIDLRLLSASVMQTIQSTGKRFWLASKPAKLTLSLNPANAVVQLEPTGTTTITISHWRSDGSAEPATFNITRQNSEAGEKGFEPFMGGSRLMYCAKASKSDRGPGNTHPTVKPLALMQYLCRLVTPPGGRLLDPFAGSGSTIVAALREGFIATGIELLNDHAAIIEARIAAETVQKNVAAGAQPDLFEGGF